MLGPGILNNLMYFFQVSNFDLDYCLFQIIKTPKHKICDVGEYILDIIIIKF